MKWYRTKLALVLSALLIGGCGGDSSSTSGSPATSPDNSEQPAKPDPDVTPSEPETVPLTPDQRFELLYRSTFGPTPSSYDVLAAQGYEAWLDNQFSKPINSHLPLLTHYMTLSDDADASPNQTDRAAVWWHQTIHAEDQLRQRVAWALSQIFVISRYGANLGSQVESMTSYYDMLLTHSFGNYRDLLEAVTLHPAMGNYLSMMANQKADPNINRFPDENYAREVMQLFSIGLYKLNQDGSAAMVDGGLVPTYTQEDIENLARIFTGWHLNERTSQWWGSRNGNWLVPMVAHADRHDTGSKKVMGHDFPAGQSAEQDMAQAMDMLLEHPNTAPFIAKHLIQRLVTSNPSPQYIERVANVFSDNGKGVTGDLKAVVKAVLLDEEALGDSVKKVKEPLVAVANVYRALQAKTADPKGRYHDSIGTFSSYGQSPLGSPSVFNFYSPDYSPNGELQQAGMVAAELEILTWNTYIDISNRLWNLVGTHDYDTEDNPRKIVVNIAPLEALANDHPALVAELDRRFLKNQMSAELKQVLLDALALHKETQQELKVRNAMHILLNSEEFFVEERR